MLFWVAPILIAFYWLCMKLSKVPKWPQWVEDECAIDPNDPPPWPEPAYYGELYDRMNHKIAFFRHEADRMRLPEDAPHRKMLDKVEQNRLARMNRNKNKKK